MKTWDAFIKKWLSAGHRYKVIGVTPSPQADTYTLTHIHICIQKNLTGQRGMHFTLKNIFDFYSLWDLNPSHDRDIT